MRSFRGIFKAFGVVFCTLICAIFVTLFPLQTTFAALNEDDFDSFYVSLMSMFENFDDEKVVLEEGDFRLEDGQVFVSEEAIEKHNLTKAGVRAISNFEDDAEQDANFFAVENLEEKDGQVVVETRINRLIVNSPTKVESFGAVAEANFKNWHIFQYASHADAQFAFQALSNSNIKVSFDFVVSADDPIEEDAGAIESSTGAHNSWADEFMGYDAFTQTTLLMHNQRDLPEVVVAVIDSGIYANHELFAGRILTQYAKNFSNETKPTRYSYQDLNEHGTHVSGTIAEFTLSNVKILPLKVLNWEGKGYGSMIVAALNYVVELKESGLNIKVANMSLGIDLSGSELLTGYAELTLAVRDAYNAGIVSVVAAGNEERDARYSSPASVEEAFTVSALYRTTNQFGSSMLKFDSSYSNFGAYIDFCAPGTSIKSANIPASYLLENRNGYHTMSGTSMATPHVSAAVALVLSNPFYADLSIDEIYDLLCENAADLGDEGRDNLYGNGCINLENLGIEFDVGDVTFSEQEKFHSQKFDLRLNYAEDENVEIYYTFGQADVVNAENGRLYSNPIEIAPAEISATNQTTAIQITAMAYFKNYADEVYQISKPTTLTYYFGNYDVLSNYEFTAVSLGYEITGYRGQDLTTLNVPSMYKSRSVVGVGAYAFANSVVENLLLPDTIRYIDQSAFSGDEKLKQVRCESTNVDVRSFAFNNCTNLQEFDVKNVTHVGESAFQNCKNLTELNLMQAKQIDLNAFKGAGIKNLFLAEDVTIADQEELSLENVYGFSNKNGDLSDAEKLAHTFDGEFQDMSLKITSDLNSTIIIREGETANFGMSFVGVDVEPTILLNGEKYSGLNISARIIGEEVEKWLFVKVSNLTGRNNKFKILLKDAYGNQVESREMIIDVVEDSSSTFALQQSGQNYSIVVTDENGEHVSNSQNFYKHLTYDLEVRPEDGYLLQDVRLFDGEKQIEALELSASIAKFHLSNVENDLRIEILTEQKKTLTITFDTQNLGEILIDGRTVIEKYSIERGETLTFKIVAKEGYDVKHVLLDGVRIDRENKYDFQLTDIVKDVQITIIFEEMRFKVNVSRGNGGNLSGNLEDDIAYGQSREYHITANDGYSIDSVTVNGKKVDVVNGNFVIEKCTQDCNIVVAFKKNGSSIFSSGSVELVYLFIFLALIFIFALAKIILTIVRKKKKKRIHL